MLGSRASEDRTASAKAAPLVHAVIFYLHADAPSGEADAIITDCHEMLASIPTVRQLRAGKPAEKEKPDNARKDYQVGLLVLFDDVKGLETYIDHPQHRQFVAKHGKFIEREKLSVYDFLDTKK
jgi:hypothetical protein